MKRFWLTTATLLLAVIGSRNVCAQLLVTTNSTWKFVKGTSEASSPTNAWRALAFDDSAWTSGAAPFYYDADPAPTYTGNTLLGDMQNTYTCIFMRQKFVASNVSSIATLNLRALCDDGFAAWINGLLVTNYNQTSGNYAYTNVASAGATEPLQWFSATLVYPGGYLVNGTNVLAVQGFNRPITSSDFLLTLELTAALADTNPPTIANVSPSPGTVSSLTQITVTFSEPVAGVGFSDLLINTIPATGVNGSGATYTFTLDQPPYGQVQISWDPGAAITDFGSPPNSFNPTGPGETWQYNLVDTTPPAVASLNPLAGVTVRSLSQIEVTFNEPVNGVNASDLLINGAPATNVTGSLAGPYVFQFIPAPAGTVQVAWASGHNIRDQAASPNNFGGGNWTYAVDPNFNVAPVRINEFVTSYSGTIGLADEDGELQDWIELYNSGTGTVSLQGWSLTDDPGEPGKWTFPAVSLGPGQYLVVFASAKDRKPTAPGAKLHANFKLNSAGDYLGLFNAASPRVVLSEFAPEFPEQRSDYSYGYDGANNLRYFQTPTPGGANGNSTIVGVVPPVHFNVQRGLFDLPFTLILDTPLADATIRYTTDGSEPTATTGQPYTGPLTISNTTILRAAAFKANYLPSTIATHTYIFLDQVIMQPNDPPGFPSTWVDTQNRSWPADYEMDPEITTDSQYSGLIKDGLRALPVMSLVAKPQDMFDNTTGIYPKSQARGPSWERPASAELILPDGSNGFQIDCGVQTQGNSVRDPQKTPKHSFRLVFKGDYGPAKLRFPLFPDSPVSTFDTLTLRADFNTSWLHWDNVQRTRAQRTRDSFMKDSQRAMGWLASHNRYVHLYVNGLYWGIYDPTERPDAGMAVEYVGGEKADYDVVNEGALVDGNMTAYNFMIGIANLADNAQYDLMKQYLDVPEYIDYVLLHFYVGHLDWGQNKNWYTIRRRAPGEGFQYFSWDGETMLFDQAYNRVTSTDTASGLHTKLVANAQYRLDFADRVQKHLFNNGALTPANVAARWMNRAAQLDLAIVAESARWGDYRRDVQQYSNGPYDLYTRNNQWLTEQNRLLTQYFPVRTANVLGQLRVAGLYPLNTSAPTFNQFGGRVSRGFNLMMSAPAGTIYYTTNGADPRVIYTGAISASAKTYAGPIALNNSVTVKARALNGSEWSALNEATFQVEELGAPLRITEIMYNPIGGDPYEFIEVQNIGAAAVDVGGFSFDGVSYVFPPATVLAPGQIIVLASSLSPGSFAARYPGVTVFGYFDLSLDNGGERLALLAPNGQTVTSVNYDDENGWPAAADGSGPSLEIIDPLGDPDDPANWRASASNTGSPGSLTAPPALGVVRLNEIMADNFSAVTNGMTNPDWIELRNTGGSSVNLASWSLSDDSNPRKFVFPSSASIAAGSYLAVWCDSDFVAPGLHTGFALDRNGESVFLYDASTNRVDAVSFGLQLPNLTVGRIGSGVETWQLCQPTLNALNVAQPLAAPTNLVVNEWLAMTPLGSDDWIELHNRHATLPAALQGLYLTTSNATFRIQSLSFVGAAGFAQLFADEKRGADHVDFKLSAEGGTIGLHDAAGAEINRVNYGPQSEGVSQGRLPDGGASIVSFPNTASPGASNYVIAYSGPTLNEVMAWNSGAVTNANGRAADWVELFNPSGSAFNVGGMSLSDEPGKPGQWIFPANTLVPANSFLVVWFDDGRPASTNNQAVLNTGRGLDRKSGGVWLYNSAGQVADFVEYGFQVENLSIGKSAGEWQLLATSTPGAANSTLAAFGPVSDLRLNEWMASPASGDDWFELFNSGSGPVSLTGLYLSDDLTISGQTKSPVGPLSFIGAQGFVKFEADDNQGKGRHHVGFQLDGQGEMLLLSDSNSNVIDAVYFGAQAVGVSTGRLPDGAPDFVSFASTPTPDGSNYLPLTNALINEVLTHTDPPLEDAIELFNPTAFAVNIGGWFLSDDATNFKKFRVPDGSLLGANGFVVFYESQINGGGGSLVPFTLDSAHGDRVFLSEADASGNATGYRSVVEFGASANGVSFGRYQTSVGADFVAMSQHTFGVSSPSSVAQFRTGAGAANAYPLVGPVVLSEIMYHPVSGTGTNVVELPEEEYIELHNINASAVPLYDLAHSTNTWQLGGGIEFAFPTSVSMAPQGYLLVVRFDPATNAVALSAFRGQYGVSNSVPVFGPFTGRLDNRGERIVLLKPDPPQGPTSSDAGFVPYVLVEQINYSDVQPWPTAADGSGASLQRIAAAEYGNDPVNWKAESPTAGRANTVTTPANQPPLLVQPANRAVDEGTTLSFTASANDPNSSDTLTFSLENAPAGATINSASGAFAWTPAEAQGPGTNVITVRVTDNGSPSLSDAKSFTVIVNEVNLAPVLPAIANRTISENTPLSINLVATDADQPPNALTYSLGAAPQGAAINANTGAFSWTPNEAQGPGNYNITVRVTDNGSPSLNHTRTFTVTVNEENSPPALSPVSDQTVVIGNTLSLTLIASDNDVPPNAVTFGLVAAPVGASLDPPTGQLDWTPNANQADTNHLFVVRVTDNGLPNLSDTTSFTVTVTSVAPIQVEVTNVTESSVTLSWNTIVGRTYRVQYKSDLGEPSWTDVAGDITADAATATKVDGGINGARQRFYRIVILD